jgi:glucokinase
MEKSDLLAPVAACIDIGGTKALLGLVTSEGKILTREKLYVAPELVPGVLAVDLAGRMHGLAERSGLDWGSVRGVGYSTTGMLDVESGVIFSSPNQGGWRDVPFAGILGDAFGLPARIEMDANAAALGEVWVGGGKGANPFVYLVVGTGIGAGILANDQILRGWRGTAGEIGHMIIKPDGPLCNCGGHGCLESLASGLAIALHAREAIKSGRHSLMADRDESPEITAETVFQAARKGDCLALEIVTQTVEYLSIALINLIHLLNPRTIALGGGVGLGGADLLLQPLRKAVEGRVGAWIDMEGTRIIPSQLGNYAGLLGAAWLVWNLLDKDQPK